MDDEMTVLHKIGITGTRSGMNQKQKEDVLEFLRVYQSSSSEFHHGDCVGVDVEGADIARNLGYKIICHPPIKDDLRVYSGFDECREALGYFARNRAIVDEVDRLIVVPYQSVWQPNGGTWYTHDYARKRGKPFTVIWP